MNIRALWTLSLQADWLSELGCGKCLVATGKNATASNATAYAAKPFPKMNGKHQGRCSAVAWPALAGAAATAEYNQYWKNRSLVTAPVPEHCLMTCDVQTCPNEGEHARFAAILARQLKGFFHSLFTFNESIF